jgi:hypothetical protein
MMQPGWYPGPTISLLGLMLLVLYVPVDEALQVIRNNLHNDNKLAERSVLQVHDKLFQQKDV